MIEAGDGTARRAALQTCSARETEVWSPMSEKAQPSLLPRGNENRELPICQSTSSLA